MAKNIKINDVTYNAVSSISVPLAVGAGNAVFPDTSDADAAAGDIAAGKTAYVNGTKITGTATGGGGGGNLKTGTVIGNGTGTITISDVTFQPSGICITADLVNFSGGFDESGAFNIFSASQFGFGSNIFTVSSSGYSPNEGTVAMEVEDGSWTLCATYSNNTVTFALEGMSMGTGAVAVSGMTYHYAIW